MEQLVAKHGEAARSRDACKVAIEERKRKQEEERVLQLQKKRDRDEAKAEKAREKAYSAEVAAGGWGIELQVRMKSSLPPPPGAYTGVYVGCVPAWCIINQWRRKMMLDLKRGTTTGLGRAVGAVGLLETCRPQLHGPALTRVHGSMHAGLGTPLPRTGAAGQALYAGIPLPQVGWQAGPLPPGPHCRPSPLLASRP
jgi:hypothetical protein